VKEHLQRRAQWIGLVWVAAVFGATSIAGAQPRGPLLPAAVKVSPGERPTINGRVDDEIWKRAPVYDQFVQQEPDAGQPATERTEVRLLHDEKAIYVSIICFDSRPDGIIATAMKRDADLNQTDSVQILFDTFNDGQNGFVFGTNPLAIEYDGQLSGEGETSGVVRSQGTSGSMRGQVSGFNPNWDAVFKVAAQTTERGWEAEFEIPFKTLRYSPGTNKTWGFNVMRNIRRKNEQVFLAEIPRGQSIYRSSLAARVPGLSPPNRRDLSVTPYALGSSSHDFTSSRTLKDDAVAAGLDLKWGITPTLTADLTINTDFAQVEADDQQIGLSRFELFFPEKRAFFLENASLFQLGQPQQIDLFFSRRIGLSSSLVPVDIVAGARLSGKLGRTNIGLLNMQTEETFDPRTGARVAPANNFGVLRAQREVGRSSFGAMFVNRQAAGDSTGFARFNRAFGLDSTIAMGRYTKLFTFVAATQSPEPRGNDWAGRAFAAYNSPTWAGHFGIARVGPDFNAEVGYVPRTAFYRPEGRIAWNSPAFRRWTFIRRATPHISWNSFYGLNGERQTTFFHFHATDFQLKNGGRIAWELNYNEDRPTTPYRIYIPATGMRTVVIPAGFYRWWDHSTVLNTNPSAKVYVEFRHKIGQFYDGHYQSFDLKVGAQVGGSLQASAQIVREPYTLPTGSFATTLVPVRVNWSFTPRLNLQALVQYNSVSSQVSSNLRLAWLLKSGTGLFVVYNDRRDTSSLTAQEALGRSFVVKFSRLLEF
jgi:hypothetical protein